NAEYQLRAQILGKVTTLTAGETRLAGTINAMATVTNRTWEYWTLRLDKAGGLPPRTVATSKARPRAASVMSRPSRTTPSREQKSKKSQKSQKSQKTQKTHKRGRTR
ncbi:MAG: hypothetical protein ACXU87_14075, partial [Xanthobacteraceae bacterium]